MKVDEFITQARDAMSVRKVFAEPIEQDGVTIIPAASLAGGGGGGQGQDEQGQEGAGGGMGLIARPAGVYVLKGGAVRWMPAVDVNRLLTVVGVVLSVYLVTRSRIIRARLAGTAGRTTSAARCR